MSCPVAHGYDPFGEEQVADPYPAFAALRRAGPVFHDPALDRWIVTRHADVEAVFRDSRRFSATGSLVPLTPLAERASAIVAEGVRNVPVMVNCDPPRQTAIRARLLGRFSAHNVTALEPRIRQRAAELAERIPEGKPVDLVAAFTFPLPALTMFTLLGFPEADGEQLKRWTSARLDLLFGRLDPQRQAEVATATAAFWRYCEEHVERRVAEPADDLASELLERRSEDEIELTPRDVASVIFALSLAAQETTTNLLGNCLLQLLRRERAWERLCAEGGLIPGLIEETLRFDSSVIAWQRVTTEAVELGGVTLPAGARLLLLLGSANRDEQRFPDGESFLPSRVNARRHLSFGKGTHFCLGAALARLEMRIALETLVERFPKLRLLDRPVPFPANACFRGPSALWAVGTAQPPMLHAQDAVAA